MEDALARAREAGERCVADIAERVDANPSERQIIAEFERLVRHGYKLVDLIVRVDGREHRLEADWIVRLFRSNPVFGGGG